MPNADPGNRPLSAPDGLRTDTLADSVLILLALTGVQKLVGLCRAVLFCRWLDADELGQWDMAFSFLLLAAPVSVLALSGSFGRYVEYYRHRRQLRDMLRRTTAFVGTLALLSGVMIFLGRGWLSELIFGTPEKTELVVLLGVSLPGVIAFHYFVDLFAAIRNARLIAGLQFLNSLTFAILGIGLLLCRSAEAALVVIAYGGACGISALAATAWLAWNWSSIPTEGVPLRHRDLWPKLIPFAAWIWATSLLANLFAVVDRYMIVHASCFSEAGALEHVGNYHSSRVIPLLLVSVSAVLTLMLTPHLTHDWEAGRHDRVAARLNLYLKLFAFGLTGAGVALMFAAPFLFNVAFGGKFQRGFDILPWTLTYCIWFALIGMAQNYMWCREKAYLASVALAAGLGVNVGLNLLLLPRMGLMGAVLATAAAHLVVLALICGLNHLLGFRPDRGTWAMLALPIVVCLNPWIGLMVLLAVGLDAAESERIFSRDEKRQLRDGLREYIERFRKLRPAARSTA